MGKLFTPNKEKIFVCHPLLVLIVAALFATTYLPIVAMAHGGEDHGAEQHPVIASTGAGTVTRTARAGEWEIVIKHPPLEPDRELAARVFITQFETNEPIGNAQVRIIISGSSSGGAPFEVTASASQTAGAYDLRLPSLPEGEYQLAAQIGANGANQTARFGALRVAPAAPLPTESVSTWARTVLLAVALLVGFGLIGVIALRVAQSSRRKEEASV